MSGSTQAEKAQLICFRETSLADGPETTKTTYTPSESAPIIALDVLPVASTGSSTGATHDILATFANGHIICLSADLETVRWVAKLDLTKVGISIDNVSTTTAKAVTRGLLRSREDIVSNMNPSAEDDSELQELTQVLCIIGRNSSGKAIVSLVQIQPRAPDLTSPPLSPLKHLESWTLHDSVKFVKASDSSTRYALHASSGTVQILGSTTLASYDLSGSVPRLYSECNVPGDEVDSFLRVAQDVVFTTSQQTCRVFDTKFNTLQAIHSLANAGTSDIASPAKKRKLNQPEVEQRNSHIQLLAYYPEHDLVVAVRDHEVIGMQLNGSFTQRRARHESTLLSDALGKGTPIISARETQKWQEEKAMCDRYASRGKVRKFERALAGNLGIPVEGKRLQRPSRLKENESKGGPMTNGVGPKISEEDAMSLDLDQNESKKENPNDDDNETLKRWNPSSVVPDGRKLQYRQYATYALQKIFLSPAATDNDVDPQIRLKIKFFPPNVFQWLLQIGQISAASVRHALLEESPQNAERLSSITDGDIAKALVEYDPDMQILSAILNHSGHLPVGEVVQAIKLLMQSINEQPDAVNTTKLLTNGTAPSEKDMDVDITSELDAASEEIDHALSVLDHGLDSRSHTLRPALIRLHSFAPRSITSTLRSMLPRHDLESLIGVLHLEMKNGGWSSEIHDFSAIRVPVMESSTEGPDDHAVAIIASLLSCTLDAIGAGAWLANVGTSADNEAGEDLIASLQADTSSALNGFWEARYMRGLLGEFLRFASQLPKSHKPSSKALERKGKPFAVVQGDDELPMLPMGAKPDMGIEKMKAGKGGKKEERSKREMGMMISKKVPKYSFERIVL